MPDYQPRPEDKFTFGLWTVGNVGRDPFGEPTRQPLEPNTTLSKLAELGVYGVSLHDNDLIPIDASAAERDRIVAKFKRTLADTGLKVTMATTNLFTDPVFKGGAFTSADARVRAYALQKTMNGIDLGAELGAPVYVFWGGREGSEVDATDNPRDGLKWFREALDFLCAYVRDQGYGMLESERSDDRRKSLWENPLGNPRGMKLALEPKPNEPRGDLYLPTVGSMLGFITTLQHPEMVGLNPEFAHETMAGLNFVHAVAQALDAGKLFHIDLNDQKMSRFDQDLRFGAENLKTAFLLVKLLEDSSYDGVRHFDAHALRTEDEAGVWEFAKGCMRTYLILKEKVARWGADAEIQQALAAYRVRDAALEDLGKAYSPQNAQAIKAASLDRAALGQRGLGLERLDQLTVELLLGVR